MYKVAFEYKTHIIKKLIVIKNNSYNPQNF